MSYHDDKREIPSMGEHFWSEKVTERDRHHCKYCSRKTKTFILVEGWRGSTAPIQHMRCCWRCGCGLELLEKAAL